MVNRYLKFIASVTLCEAAGLLATPITTSAIPTWYATLNKPGFAPPNWLFAPVWTILFFMMGVSLYLVWSLRSKKRKSKVALGYFFVQLGLNFLWSYMFFGLRSPLFGLINIVALWILIFATIKKFYPISKTAAYLLIPYLLWVSFATLLNASILVLN